MDAHDLEKLLEQSDNKLSIFANVELLKKYKFNAQELFDMISTYLSDDEKLKLFDYSHFNRFPAIIKSGIIGTVSDENIILQMLNNDNVTNNFDANQLIVIIEKLSDSAKIEILHNQNFITKHDFPDYQLTSIITNLTDKGKSEILVDVDLVRNILHLSDTQITDLAKNLSNDNEKDNVIQKYKLDDFYKKRVLKSCSNNYKVNILLKEKDFSNYDRIDLLQTLDTKTLIDFLSEHKKFCSEINLKPYQIICNLSAEQQKEFIKNIENINLTLNEKKEIIATLKDDVKQSINTDKIPEIYKPLLEFQSEYGRVILDLERNPKDYKDLDNLIIVNPENFTEEQKIKFMKLCEICPNLKVENTLLKTVSYYSTGSEYKVAEEWISSIIDNLPTDYSKAQKLAVIDNAIGKKISYSPDYDTEIFNHNDCRALWKIISSEYGICNGIANVEKYILNRIGIETEPISGEGHHAFLKIKNIDFPLANGETVKGNTILDPTWNLGSHRFGGRPNNFCISYEHARKNDIDENGKDHKCHKNDEQLQDATLDLDEESLRKLFSSVNLARENGDFPVKDLLDKSKQIDQVYANDPEQNMNKQLLLLSKICPEFATCQNSSMSVLSGVLLNNKNLTFNKCVVNRVYQKQDKEKRPLLYVYINSNEFGNKFYYADQNLGKFIDLPQEEFVKQFECYEDDLKKENGLRPWETKSQDKQNADLSISSGKIIAEDGGER